MDDKFIKAPRHCNYKSRCNRYVLLHNIFDLRLINSVTVYLAVIGGYCFGIDFGHVVMENLTATLSATMIILTISPRIASDIASKTFNRTFRRIGQENVADICSVFFIVLFFCHPLLYSMTNNSTRSWRLDVLS